MNMKYTATYIMPNYDCAVYEGGLLKNNDTMKIWKYEAQIKKGEMDLNPWKL